MAWVHGARSRVDRACATETVDTGSIPGRVKPKTIKTGIHSFLLDVQQLKGLCEASTGSTCLQVDRWAGGSLTRTPKVPLTVS